MLKNIGTFISEELPVVGLIYKIMFGLGMAYGYFKGVHDIFAFIGEKQYLSATITFFFMQISALLTGLVGAIVWGSLINLLLSPVFLIYLATRNKPKKK